MKQFKTLIIAIVLFFGAQFASAQTKVGHIDVSALMTTMPAMKTAEAQTGGPIASLNTEGYCVVDTCTVLRTLVNQMKSKKVFIE